MDKIVVTITGIAVLAGIYWFFFGQKEVTTKAATRWDILVSGGYKPSTITIKEGEQTTLTVTRTDTNSCLEEIVFPDYKIKEYLPLNKPVTVILPPSKKGTSSFHCSMQMFHGKIEIV